MSRKQRSKSPQKQRRQTSLQAAFATRLSIPTSQLPQVDAKPWTPEPEVEQTAVMPAVEDEAPEVREPEPTEVEPEPLPEPELNIVEALAALDDTAVMPVIADEQPTQAIPVIPVIVDDGPDEDPGTIEPVHADAVLADLKHETGELEEDDKIALDLAVHPLDHEDEQPVAHTLQAPPRMTLWSHPEEQVRAAFADEIHRFGAVRLAKIENQVTDEGAAAEAARLMTLRDENGEPLPERMDIDALLKALHCYADRTPLSTLIGASA